MARHTDSYLLVHAKYVKQENMLYPPQSLCAKMGTTQFERCQRNISRKEEEQQSSTGEMM